jgi:hypothetical protein
MLYYLWNLLGYKKINETPNECTNEIKDVNNEIDPDIAKIEWDVLCNEKDASLLNDKSKSKFDIMQKKNKYCKKNNKKNRKQKK